MGCRLMLVSHTTLCPTTFRYRTDTPRDVVVAITMIRSWCGRLPLVPGTQSGIWVVGEAADGVERVELACRLRS